MADAPKLFISYRREDSAPYAGRLHDELSRRFGQDQVFMDLTMEPGVDFVDQINKGVGACRLLVAVIGPNWASAADGSGRRRIDDPDDFVRIEVEAALRQRDVVVVPVLVHGARMPTPDELPPPLAGLARRNALELSDARWRYDVDRLTSTVERVLGVERRRTQVFATTQLPVAGEEASEGDEIGATRARPRKRRRTLLAAAIIVVALIVLAVALSSGGSGPRPADVKVNAAMDGKPVRVTISRARQQAVVSFHGRAGHRVSPDLREVQFTGIITLIDPADEVLISEESFDETGGLFDARHLTRDGTYRLTIDPDGDNTGSLKVRLYDVPPDVVKPVTVDGPAVPIAIKTPGQVAKLRFRARVGEKLVLTLDNVEFDGAISVTDPGGTKVVDGDSFSREERYVSSASAAKKSGSYEIRIDPNDNSIGRLDLRLLQP